VWWFAGGGSSDVADDGPHKLTTPATVLGEYKKTDSSSGDGDDFLKDAETSGVKNGKEVDATYEVKDEQNPLAGKMLQFGGVYGEVEDPEAVVDTVFATIKAESTKEKDAEVELVGEPKTYSPAEGEGAVVKCQQIKTKPGESDASAMGPKEITMSVCVWGDHSTVGFVMPMDLASLMAGKGTPPEEAAAITAKVRKEVRVKL
jgi:hypothetical protein